MQPSPVLPNASARIKPLFSGSPSAPATANSRSKPQTNSAALLRDATGSAVGTSSKELSDRSARERERERQLLGNVVLPSKAHVSPLMPAAGLGGRVSAIDGVLARSGQKERDDVSYLSHASERTRLEGDDSVVTTAAPETIAAPQAPPVTRDESRSQHMLPGSSHLDDAPPSEVGSTHAHVTSLAPGEHLRVPPVSVSTGTAPSVGIASLGSVTVSDALATPTPPLSASGVTVHTHERVLSSQPSSQGAPSGRARTPPDSVARPEAPMAGAENFLEMVYAEPTLSPTNSLRLAVGGQPDAGTLSVPGRTSSPRADTVVVHV